MLLIKDELNTIDALISNALIDSNITHDELFLVNYVVKKSDDMKEAIKNGKTPTVYWKF